MDKYKTAITDIPDALALTAHQQEFVQKTFQKRSWYCLPHSGLRMFHERSSHCRLCQAQKQGKPHNGQRTQGLPTKRQKTETSSTFCWSTSPNSGRIQRRGRNRGPKWGNPMSIRAMSKWQPQPQQQRNGRQNSNNGNNGNGNRRQYYQYWQAFDNGNRNLKPVKCDYKFSQNGNLICHFCDYCNHVQKDCRKRISANKPCVKPEGTTHFPTIASNKDTDHMHLVFPQ